MTENTIAGEGGIVTRIKRAFNWVVLFRDFEVGVTQEFLGLELWSEAVTYITKGRAELYLDDQRRPDRVPGILSLDVPINPDSEGKIWRLVTVEPSTRVCIPKTANRGLLPVLTKIELVDGQTYTFPVGFRGLVCLGQIDFGTKQFAEESTFTIKDQEKTGSALGTTYILNFTNA